MTGRLRLAVVVPFLDEERHLGVLLSSLDAQRRRPDRLLLVDDGSTDASVAVADAFARRHGWVTVLRRPARRVGADRLAGGSALQAFAWGVAHLGEPWDVVAKIDADLRLTPATLGTLEAAFLRDPALGVAGAFISAFDSAGRVARQRLPRQHVEGETKFYRRACWDEIAPLPAMTGWDTIDVVRARLRGWRTESFEVPGGDPLHLRTMGSRDGVLRAYRRWGRCAWSFGEHPVHALAVAVQRAGDDPPVLGAVNYLAGYAGAAIVRAPRAEAEVRAYVRRDQLRRLRRRIVRGPEVAEPTDVGMPTGRLRMVAIVAFLDEERYLPILLESVAAQERALDALLLVDDGSTDRSAAIAGAFAARHPFARLVQRPSRPEEQDRMARANEWRAFAWALERAPGPWDVVAKLDADLQLAPDLFAVLERRFLADPRLGIAGAYLSQRMGDGRLVRQRCPAGHVEGPNRFYRRACLEAISPIPPILGWDTIDEARARRCGWRTQSFPLGGDDVVHLRRLGSYDGVLRGYRRAGWAAYAYGAHPAHVLASAAARLRDRPLGACAAAYLGGYAAAVLRREPRAEPETRAVIRSEQRSRLATLGRGGAA
jgi:glycosyltransferase involved in cell wall biosynthesis